MLGKSFQNGDAVKFLYDQGRRVASIETKNKNDVIISHFGYGYNRIDLKNFEKRLYEPGLKK